MCKITEYTEFVLKLIASHADSKYQIRTFGNYPHFELYCIVHTVVQFQNKTKLIDSKKDVYRDNSKSKVRKIPIISFP